MKHRIMCKSVTTSRTMFWTMIGLVLTGSAVMFTQIITDFIQLNYAVMNLTGYVEAFCLLFTIICAWLLSIVKLELIEFSESTGDRFVCVYLKWYGISVPVRKVRLPGILIFENDLSAADWGIALVVYLQHPNGEQSLLLGPTATCHIFDISQEEVEIAWSIVALKADKGNSEQNRSPS